jgi:hypothetical protein
MVAAIVCLSITQLAQAQDQQANASDPPKEIPLTNADVEKMVHLGLGDEIVVAKIKEAKTVAFRTDVDSLEKLKSDGISTSVITAMLQKETAPSSPAPQEQSSEEKLANTALGLMGPSEVVLCTKGGDFKLASIGGSVSSTYAFVTMLMFADFPGRHASVRTKDARPSILLHSQNSPTGRYFFVKAKSNEKDDTRSVKMGRMHLFTVKSITAPDKDWVIKVSLTQESPGVWRLTPERDLEPGEYGILDAGGSTPQMYDFGIDR